MNCEPKKTKTFHKKANQKQNQTQVQKLLAKKSQEDNHINCSVGVLHDTVGFKIKPDTKVPGS